MPKNSLRKSKEFNLNKRGALCNGKFASNGSHSDEQLYKLSVTVYVVHNDGILQPLPSAMK